jgi:nucleoside-diphosphate-sugar epimerase
MKVFVAGGTGQLGQAAIPALVAAGHLVRATARGEEKAAVVSGLGAEPVDVDLFDSGALRRAITRCDAVLRLTTKIPRMTQMRRPSSWEANNRLRTEGAHALVDAVLAEGIGRYVSESVTFVYADAGDDWIDETRPVDLAGLRILETMLASETEAERVTAAGGAGVVLRFGSFYSPTSEQTRQIWRMTGRKMFPVIGAGDSYYSSVAVSDAGRAVAASLAVPAGVYNVVDDEPLRYRDYVQAYVDAMDGPSPMRVPSIIGRTMLGKHLASYLLRSQRVTNRRLRAASDWSPVYPTLPVGLAAFREQLTSA